MTLTIEPPRINTLNKPFSGRRYGELTVRYYVARRKPQATDGWKVGCRTCGLNHLVSRVTLERGVCPGR